MKTDNYSISSSYLHVQNVKTNQMIVQSLKKIIVFVAKQKEINNSDVKAPGYQMVGPYQNHDGAFY